MTQFKPLMPCQLQLTYSVMPRKQNVQCNHWPRTCTVMGSHFNPIPFSEDNGHFNVAPKI